MNSKKHVDYGEKLTCSISADHTLTGCRFSLAPMSDRFIDIILGAVKKTDTSKVWSDTDELSTIYRGRRIHVWDALKACFINAYTEGVHMTMEATVSKGCPGDTLADSYIALDDTLANESSIADIHFPTVVKFALYPMGIPDYMRYIADVVNRSIDLGIYDRTAHYVTVLKGDVQDIFSFLEEASAYCEDAVSHYIMEITFAVNLPEEQAL